MTRRTEPCVGPTSKPHFICRQHGQPMTLDGRGSGSDARSRTEQYTYPVYGCIAIVDREIMPGDHLPPSVGWGSEGHSSLDDEYRPPMQRSYDPDLVTVVELPDED